MLFGPNLIHKETPHFLSTIEACTLPFCSLTSTSNHFDYTPKLPFLALLLTPTKPSPCASNLVSPSSPSGARRSPRSLPSLSPSLTLTLSLAHLNLATAYPKGDIIRRSILKSRALHQMANACRRGNFISRIKVVFLPFFSP